ncbi:MAG: DUF2079 domain-containing protein [Candidatus Kerfeldbacteria bacterium]
MPEPPIHPLLLRARKAGERVRSYLIHREKALLITGAMLFVVVFSLIGAWKLWAFGYNSLDLAIYSQVASTTLHGQPFSFTIHPHSYLGDHFEILFIVLVPFYALVKSPFTLVVVQAIALAISVFPIAKIAERFVGKPMHLLFALSFLANPIVQNMSLFEFHMLAFAIPILSFAILAYLKGKFSWYVPLILLALTVREDVSLVVIGLGILALVDRRSWKWSLLPIISGIGWFFGSMRVISILNGYGQYKFLAYYGWLGGSMAEIAKNFFLHLDRVLLHLVAPSSLSFVAALLLPCAFLPLMRFRWLIPVVPTLFQLLLMQTPSELIVEIHYPSVFIPFLILASAAAFQGILKPSGKGLLSKFGSERPAAVVVYLVVIIYTMLAIGPLAQSVPVIAASPKIANRVSLERDFVASVPNVSTVGGYETLTDLSARLKLYSLHYEFLGKKQYSKESYTIPSDISAVLLDMRDFLMYQLLYKLNDKDNRNGYSRIRTLLKERGFILTAYVDRFALFEKGKSTISAPLYSTEPPMSLNGTPSQHDNLSFIGWSTPTNVLAATTQLMNRHSYAVLPVSLSFTKTDESNDIENIRVQYLERGRVKHSVVLPLGGGLFPPSDWTIGKTVTSNYRLLIPDFLNKNGLEVSILVYRSKGEVSLNGVRSLVIKYQNPTTLGEPIGLGTVSFLK